MMAKYRLDRNGAIERPAAVTADLGAVEILSVWLGSDETNMVLVKPVLLSDLPPRLFDIPAKQAGAIGSVSPPRWPGAGSAE